MIERDVRIPTDRGPIEARFTPPSVARAPSSAALLVGGADGGFDGPATALYPDLAADFAERGIATLRLDFRIHRFPNDPEEGTYDALAGIRWLEAEGIERIVLVGHSFGGAVVIEAGAASPSVAAVATLSTQTAGVHSVERIAPRPLLLVHGLDDIRLTPDCSRYLHRLAGEPKRLVLLESATHSLRQRREEVRSMLLAWVEESLSRSA